MEARQRVEQRQQYGNLMDGEKYTRKIVIYLIFPFVLFCGSHIIK